MRTGTVAFLVGILLLLRCSALPPATLIYFLVLLTLILVAIDARLHLAGWLLCGYAWALFNAHAILAPGLDPDLESKTLTLTGRVVSLPEIQEGNIRFEYQVDAPVVFAGKQWSSPGKIRLSWYQNPPHILPGQFWKLKVRLKRPHGFMNPGGFDYEGWLFQHRIRATGYVIKSTENQYTGVTSGSHIDRLRYMLRAGINRHLDNKYRGLIIALTLGDRSQTSHADRTTMINTGTYHLLAISGLQISLVAGFFYFAVVRLWSYTGKWAVIFPAPRLAAISALVSALIYALLAGFSIPTQRALVMFAVLMSVIFIRRCHAISNGICLAVLAVLIWDPFAVMDPGFWLSFGAITALAWGMSCRAGASNLWWRWGRAQYVVFLGLLPLSILWFQQYALNGMLANIIAIPWLSMVTTPLAMTGMALVNFNGALGGFFLFLAKVSLQLIWPFLEWLGQWHFSIWHHAAPSPWIFAAALAGVIIVLLPAGVPWRWLGILWMFPLLLPVRDIPDYGQFRFTLLDVGQGLAAVIHTRNHTLVYDTGARFNADFNAGSAVVAPYLRQAGVTQIDTLIVSHGDNDHSGGVSGLLQVYPETVVLSSAHLVHANPAWRRCYAGQHWEWDGIKFHMLHPSGNYSGTGNNQSCVVRVSNADYSILLPGDIEKHAETRLLQTVRDKLPATVLVAPHHGSKTSSTVSFIAAVQPRIVLFPVGYRNRYHFPNQDIMRRYEIRGSRSYDTGRDGAVLVRINQSGITVTTWRREARRFWHTVEESTSR